MSQSEIGIVHNCDKDNRKKDEKVYPFMGFDEDTENILVWGMRGQNFARLWPSRMCGNTL